MSDTGTQTQTDVPGIYSTTGDEVALTKLKSNHAEEVSQLWVKIYSVMGAIRRRHSRNAMTMRSIRISGGAKRDLRKLKSSKTRGSSFYPGAV